MNIEFDKDYLLELFEEGKTKDKKHRYQPAIIKNYQKVVLILASVKYPEDLFRFNSLHYEVLDGDKKGISSVRINLQYRLEFTVREDSNEPLVEICRLIEISNHYK